MNNFIDLRVRHSLELMRQLKETASDFALKESQLSRELSLKRSAETRKYRSETERMENWLATETTTIRTRFAEREARSKSLYENRRQRIEQARRKGVHELSEQAGKARERYLGQLQMRHFNATRNLPLLFKAEEESFANSSNELGIQQALFAKLEQQVRFAFRGYPAFLGLVRHPRNVRVETTAGYGELFAKVREQLPVLKNQLSGFRELFLPRLFSWLPPYIFIPALLLICVTTAIFFHSWVGAGAVPAAVLTAAILLLHRRGGHGSQKNASEVAQTLVEIRNLLYASAAALRNAHDATRNRIQKDYDLLCDEVNTQWARAGEIEQTFAVNIREKIERQAPRLLEKNEQLFRPKVRKNEAEQTACLAELDLRAEAWKRQISTSHTEETRALSAEEEIRWKELVQAWTNAMTPLYQALSSMNALLGKYAPPWDLHFVESWTPPTDFPPGAKFATLQFELSGTLAPKDPRLSLPGPAQVWVPLALSFPAEGALLFETSGSEIPTVIATLNDIILRLLSTTAPGKLAFTILDPVGLGQNFAGLMHLADYEESLINRRIWTQRDQIEERLAELNEHIEKVIQMYLRNEYPTITEYNAQAGSVAEKYHFLVVADFPANFSETAVKRLQSIAVSGARCGVFTLIHWDRRQQQPDGFVPDELRKNSVCLSREKSAWHFQNEGITPEGALVFDPPPSPELAIDLVHRIGRSSIDSNRIEVPFSQIAPKDAELWTNDTTHELKIPIGRTGVSKLQCLAIGKGTRQHALFAGKTGSGKSTLFHVIITNLALSCSPDQVEFYLIDFKKGVEFKCYATHRLPHARVVAIESDREFGLSVLRRVDEELKRRGDMFRALGVQDIAGYKKAGGREPVPRTLLIIDEFQEFFVEDDEISQTASLLFDRIIRQGRAFGIHVLLGSQTLGGAYTLARATLGQMVIRVALQCNEADAYLIMDENNSAPRLLSRPGEGIYNDAAGAIEGNSPFQVVWLSDEERDNLLGKVHALATQRGFQESIPIVFEGNSPADVRENLLLRSAIEGSLSVPHEVSKCWLGAPNSIKGPTEVVFHRQSGNHLLVVGQRDETITSMLALSLLALAAQYPPGMAKFILFHTGSPGTEDLLASVAGNLSRNITIVQPNEVAGMMNDLASELQTRSESESDETSPPIFVFIHGLQKFKKLRHEDEFDFSSGSDATPGPGAQLNTLIAEGSSHGIHLIVTFDTFNNIGRSLSRKALGEFEMRVVFQMSANDSASLIDSPQAAGLGLHRALFYNEREGYLETFRPYAPPDPEWTGEVFRKLSRFPATTKEDK